MRRSLRVSLALVVLATVGGLIGTFLAGNEPQLGLDLQGGLAVVLQPVEEDVETDQVDQAIEVIRSRVDALGVAEPEITRRGSDVVIQLPGVRDADRALDLVGQTAELRFRPVLAELPYDAESAGLLADLGESLTTTTTVPEGPATTAPGATTAPEETTTTTLAEPEPVPPEDVITGREDDVPEVQVILPDPDDELLYLLEPAQVFGSAVETADASLDPQTFGNWQVNVVFTSDGSAAFNQMAAANVGRQVAIVLDGLVYSAPVINESSFAGSAVITGDFSEQEAKDLATVLRFGALPVSFEPQGVETVSATLGSDTLDAAILAGAVGLALVGAFMIAYYRVLGIVAMLSLAVSGGLLWTIISYIGTNSGLALTVAGATGIIVSIGVQVDSNVVYYERLKEEVRRGRSLRAAAESTFRGAFSTIVKADLASLIGAGLLFWLTVGAVRGFALFLGIATLLDLVVSFLFMRPLVVLIARSRRFSPRQVIGIDELVVRPGTAS